LYISFFSSDSINCFIASLFQQFARHTHTCSRQMQDQYSLYSDLARLLEVLPVGRFHGDSCCNRMMMIFEMRITCDVYDGAQRHRDQFFTLGYYQNNELLLFQSCSQIYTVTRNYLLSPHLAKGPSSNDNAVCLSVCLFVYSQSRM